MPAAIPVPPRLAEDLHSGDGRNTRLFLQNVKERIDKAHADLTSTNNQLTVLRNAVTGVIGNSASTKSSLQGQVNTINTTTTSLQTQITNRSVRLRNVTTSGTSTTFTIPNTTERFTVSLEGVSTNGTSVMIVQLGTGGTPVVTGYLGTVSAIAGATTTSTLHNTGIATETTTQTASDVKHGSLVFTLSNAATNTWVVSGVLALSNNNRVFHLAGQIALSGGIDTVKVTMVNGTDTFDAGAISVYYEVS